MLDLDQGLGDYVIVHELLHFFMPNHGKLWKSGAILIAAKTGKRSARHVCMRMILGAKANALSLTVFEPAED